MNELDDTMIQKALKCLVCKENRNQDFYVHCYIICWHSYSLRNNMSFYLHTKLKLRGTFKGVGWNSVFQSGFICLGASCLIHYRAFSAAIAM